MALLLVLAVAPAAFWLWYFRARDRLRPEPRHLVARVFFLGGGAAFAAGVLEVAVFGVTGVSLEGARAPSILAAAAAIGLIEEAMKFAVVFLGVYRHAAFDEVLDGIIYAVAAALGFATLENIFYVLQGGAAVGLARALLAVPGHAFFGAVMGFYLGIAKFAGERAPLWLAAGVAAAALAHTLYDALVFSRGSLALATVPFVIFLWRRAIVHTRRAQALDARRGEGT